MTATWWVRRAGPAAALVLLAGCAGVGAGNGDRSSLGTLTRATSSVTAAPSRSAGAAQSTASPERTATTASSSSEPAATASTSGPLAGRVIVLDPGHNGENAEHTDEISQLVDAGGFEKACNTVGTQTSSGFPEATFNWEVGQLLAARLRADDATVILTRRSNDGWGPCIDARGRIAAENHADLLLSIHADGAASTEHGFHVISPSPLDGYTTATRAARSAALARAVRDAMVDARFVISTYAGTAGLVVRGDLGTLNLAGVPAAMIECGNMLNPGDSAVMESKTGRGRIAAALAAGVRHFLSNT